MIRAGLCLLSLLAAGCAVYTGSNCTNGHYPMVLGDYVLSPDQHAMFPEGAAVEVLEDGSWSLELKLAEKDLRRFLKRENLAEEQLMPEPMETSAPAANE